MSMPLMEDISLERIRDELEGFDFLHQTDTARQVLKAMELHADDMNDSEFVFVFWVHPDAGEGFADTINSWDLTRERHPTDTWKYRATTEGSKGIVVVWTFL